MWPAAVALFLCQLASVSVAVANTSLCFIGRNATQPRPLEAFSWLHVPKAGELLLVLFSEPIVSDAIMVYCCRVQLCNSALPLCLQPS